MNELGKYCPYLGLIDDPGTHMSFSSDWNCCHHANPVIAINNSHQQAFCLTEDYAKCPIYRSKDAIPMPAELSASKSQFSRKGKLNWKILLVGVLVIIAVALIINGFVNSRQNLFSETVPISTQSLATVTMTITESPTIRPAFTSFPVEALLSENERVMTFVAQTMSPEPTMTISPTVTKTTTPTLTLTPTKTLTPTLKATNTSTPEPQKYELDTPIGKEYQFVIHKVKGGENLNQFATLYHTSVEAIIRVNYVLNIPLWVDALIVLPVDFTDVTQMPYFQPYEVTTDGITVETLTKELSTDLDDFLKYNMLAKGEQLNSGDWLLVPRYKSAN